MISKLPSHAKQLIHQSDQVSQNHKISHNEKLSYLRLCQMDNHQQIKQEARMKDYMQCLSSKILMPTSDNARSVMDKKFIQTANAAQGTDAVQTMNG
jgi:hypothetical protein